MTAYDCRVNRLVAVLLGAALPCAAVLVAGMACEAPRQIPPDYALWLSDSGHFRFDPIVSPDGRSVYYLDDTTWVYGALPSYHQRGGLRVFGLNDSVDRLLFPGRFYDLALSPDGMRLAVVADSPNGRRTASRLITLDTGAAHADTLVVSHIATSYQIGDMHFLQSGAALLYCVRTDSSYKDYRFYSVPLEPGSKETLLFQFPGYLEGFDVFKGDSIYVDSLVRDDPAVNPVHTRWVAYTYSDHWKLMLKDRSAGTVRRVDYGTRPHEDEDDFIAEPNWAPNGNQLFFSSAVRDADRVEIWSLENAGDYLPITE
jgi:dipeptidyl aminopeptidase/acylaminoacyl peptidase